MKKNTVSNLFENGLLYLIELKNYAFAAFILFIGFIISFAAFEYYKNEDKKNSIRNKDKNSFMIITNGKNKTSNYFFDIKINSYFYKTNPNKIT